MLKRNEICRSFLILPLSFIVLSSCTEEYTPLSPAEQDPVEFNRQVTMAFIELNNYAKALKWYRQDYEEDPENIEELVYYLNPVYGSIRPLESIDFDSSQISPERYELYTLWRFDFTKLLDTLITFEAYSLVPFIDGADHIISYDTRTGEFSGYGNDRVNPHTYILLFEEPIEPNLRLPVSGETIAPEQWQQLNTIRQVNWAANQLVYLRRAVIWYRQDYGDYPLHIDSLLIQEYLELDRPVQIWWDFGLTFEHASESGFLYVSSIYAVSTEAMAGNCCDTLFFDIWSRNYYGEWSNWKSPFVGL